MLHPKTKVNVLFLCTGNSCRSQIAEALTRHLKSDLIECWSAGTEPKGVNPMAIQVLEEDGIDTSSLRSKEIAEVTHIPFDYVVTLCSSAADRCPAFPGDVKTVHVGFEDPDAAEGSDEIRLQVFRHVRDGIREYVESLPVDLEHYLEDE